MTAPRPLRTLRCSECGLRFAARRRDALTCSGTCRKRRYDRIREDARRDADTLAVLRRLVASPQIATTQLTGSAFDELIVTARALVDSRPR